MLYMWILDRCTIAFSDGSTVAAGAELVFGVKDAFYLCIWGIWTGLAKGGCFINLVLSIFALFKEQ